jgi:hypothetical protein
MVCFIIINTSFDSLGSRKEDLRTQVNHATKCLIWDQLKNESQEFPLRPKGIWISSAHLYY